MCAWGFTSEGATNSSSSAFAGVLSLWARQRRGLFPHFTGLSNRRREGERMGSISGFTPKEHDGESC